MEPKQSSKQVSVATYGRGALDFDPRRDFSLMARSWLVENPNLLNWSLLLKSFFGLLALSCSWTPISLDVRIYIRTLATKLGVRNIAFLGTGLMLLNYVVGVLAAIYMPQIFRRNVMIPAHIILASCLIFQAWALEQAKYSKEAASKFYRFIWDLLYLEYLIYPFI
ncbi:hypothetical protein ACOSQ3_009137 [Xanthoceras sorbifolium]